MLLEPCGTPYCEDPETTPTLYFNITVWVQAGRLRDHLGEVLLEAYALKQQACCSVYMRHAK